MSSLTKNENLFADIKELIEQTKQNVAIAVNSTLTMMYWTIGKKINDDILQNKRADYGKEIVSTLSRQLKEQYGDGYSLKNLRHMMKFNEVLSDFEKVVTVLRQLLWKHFLVIFPIKNELVVYDIGLLAKERYHVKD